MTTAAHFSQELFPSYKRAAQECLKYLSTAQTVWEVELQLAHFGLIWSQFNTTHGWLRVASKDIAERLFCPHSQVYEEKRKCENCPAYLPGSRTATCLCRVLVLSSFLSSALCILLSLITAFHWHLTSFANVTCEDRALLCVCAATTHVLLRLVRALNDIQILLDVVSFIMLLNYWRQEIGLLPTLNYHTGHRCFWYTSTINHTREISTKQSNRSHL